jgi:tripartite-type tricarboxylate transporter receptor subunit TctC
VRVLRALPNRLAASFALALVALMLPAADAAAQPYPHRPVKIVVPFTPGGSADTLGRLVAQKLADSLKQSFVIENRGGAGGVIGSELVAKAPADGYTLVVSGVASHVVAPAVAKAPFDPLKDFTHIALFGGPPIALVVHPATGVSDLKDLLAAARIRSLTFGSPGNGTHGHLIGELLKQTARIEMQHAPYKGASQAIADLLANHIPVASTTLTTAGAQIRAGKIRALAITTTKRLPDYPDVPTFVELGYPQLVATTWFSLSGPAGLPADIVSLLNAEVRKALVAPDVREKTRTEGIEPNDLDARQFADFVQAEIRRWTPIVKASSAKAD